MSDSSDSFYVGYHDAPPPGLAGWLRVRVLLTLVLLAGIGATLGFTQRRLPPKVFEWGNVSTFVGYVVEDTVPLLRVRRPGESGERQSAWSRYVLVGVGKHGAGEAVRGFGGELVELEGTLIYRGDQTMIEVVGGSVRRLSAATAQTPPPVSAAEALGSHTFVGEIVDSKCYLGVMAPGSTKVHRACAMRCIHGGIPPVLLVRQPDGRATYLFLTTADGRPVNQAVGSMIAEPVEITGDVVRHGDMLLLRADPVTYRRLDS